MPLLSLVLATSNPGKVREFGRLLGGSVNVRAMSPTVALPAESGDTFRANARLKAEAVFGAMEGRVAVLADDSGLEVAALSGRPGVLSARFAGEGASDDENVTKLLRELACAREREALFVCSLCLVLPATPAAGERSDVAVLVEVEGVSAGMIMETPRGTDGFGYDPVFQPQGWSRTLAEASPEDKDRVSHRGAAARALLAALAARGLVSRGS
ncbi:MAG: hypothetical protein A2133_01575 [Actinobacteria bacterium RBG_16_64_13]|nr:MAG: hypothetical protein A2133_01575 [Actinobacteria bacterium RBG_16_64_13]